VEIVIWAAPVLQATDAGGDVLHCRRNCEPANSVPDEPSSPGEIQPAKRTTQVLRHAACKRKSVAVLAEEYVGIQNLRAGKEVDAAKVELWFCLQSVERFYDALFIDPKRGGTAPHAHRAAFRFAARIDANGNRHAPAKPDPPAQQGDALGFAKRFHMNLAYIVREGQLKLGFGFPRAGKEDSRWIAARVECSTKFSG
jgi:hypothetical protein